MDKDILEFVFNYFNDRDPKSVSIALDMYDKQKIDERKEV